MTSSSLLLVLQSWHLLWLNMLVTFLHENLDCVLMLPSEHIMTVIVTELLLTCLINPPVL